MTLAVGNSQKLKVKNLPSGANESKIKTLACKISVTGKKKKSVVYMTKEHGFTKIAKVDIMDSAGSMTLPVSGGTHLKKNYEDTDISPYKVVHVGEIKDKKVIGVL